MINFKYDSQDNPESDNQDFGSDVISEIVNSYDGECCGEYGVLLCYVPNMILNLYHMASDARDSFFENRASNPTTSVKLKNN